MTSLVTYAEARAALAAADRSGRLRGRAARLARERLEQRWSELAALAVDDAVVHDAGALADRHGLRGYDAVHLASALLGADAIATWDAALAAASRAAGVSVIP